MNFELISDYQPTGDQPEAIAQLTEGILKGVPAQTLLGVTGSGKTFTIANVIKNINKPTLILSHNKTLAAQLYGEFKNFFPNNAVEYYVSYYDYYQPEAYLPSSDTYIEKDLQINEEIDKLRLAALPLCFPAVRTWWSFLPYRVFMVWETLLISIIMSLKSKRVNYWTAMCFYAVW